MSNTKTPDQVDVRGPRFAAWVTTVVLVVTLIRGLDHKRKKISTQPKTVQSASTKALVQAAVGPQPIPAGGGGSIR